jgi:hypothetical protein
LLPMRAAVNVMRKLYGRTPRRDLSAPAYGSATAAARRFHVFAARLRGRK